MVDFSERITILTANEIEEIYGLPTFSDEERELYFAMDTKEQRIAFRHRTLSSKLFFILQLGYFKAKKMFFPINDGNIETDIKLINNRYFPGLSLPKDFRISKGTQWNQQQLILNLYNFHDCNAFWKAKLQVKARRCVRISSKPVYIFKDLIGYLEKSKVALPAYSTMQKIISKAVLEERERLSKLSTKHITKDIENRLLELLNKEDNFYLLTSIKKEPKDFKFNQISQEIEKQKSLTPLYDFAKDFIPLLDISNDNINYYASLVDYYSVFQIRGLRSEITTVYLLCFIFHRYHRINDNLVNAFIYQIRKIDGLAKLAGKLRVYELKIEGNREMDNVGKVLNLFTDEKISNEIAFGEVKKLAFGFLEENKFPLVTQYISKAKFDQAEFKWQEVEALAQKFKKNLRPIFSALDFQSTSKKNTLMEAVCFLKKSFLRKKSLTTIKPDLFPQSFIRRKLKRYIVQKTKTKVHGSTRKVMTIHPDRYEFLVYSLLWRYLESGDVYIHDSARYRSFEEYLIDDERWKNKDQLIHDLGYSFLSKPIEKTLAQLKGELETLLVNVNKRIKEGENKSIKITGKGENVKWRLPYKKPEDATNHPLFEHLPQIEIRDLLIFVDSQCGFMNAFTHILGRYVKSESENDTVIGSVIALATNKGLFKMAESSDLTYQNLFSSMKNYLRTETLRNANDNISNAIFRLPIFEYFNIAEGIIHSSSDGQKFESIDTINARHSPKYFGLKKGVTSYTMIANNVPVNAKIIGANDHESHFVFDIVYNNTSDIASDRHSVDTHGTNNVNFLILHAFTYEFAPRYRDIGSKSETIYGFKHPKHYDGFLLKPAKKGNEKLIIDEWPNIQRILVSLGLKNTTQNVIIGKLSSYSRKNRTKKAIWELDNILRSIYILRYVDDLLLRQNVQRALNRGEAYHQIRRAIPHEHSGKLRVETEEDQLVWSECSRLVANAIIFYNSYLLSKLLAKLENNKRIDLVERIKGVSPIAWRHVNLGGRFELTSTKKTTDIDTMMAMLEEFLYNSKK